MFDITQHIHQSNLIEGYDSPEADRCLKLAWDILRHQDKLNHVAICKAQKTATDHQNDLKPNMRGFYRGRAGNNVNVSIAGRQAPGYAIVTSLMDNWLLDLDTQTPKANHIRFEGIHPFVDGNGRVGRLIMWWQELKAGLEPTLIEYKHRQAYYNWF